MSLSIYIYERIVRSAVLCYVPHVKDFSRIVFFPLIRFMIMASVCPGTHNIRRTRQQQWKTLFPFRLNWMRRTHSAAFWPFLRSFRVRLPFSDIYPTSAFIYTNSFAHIYISLISRWHGPHNSIAARTHTSILCIYRLCNFSVSLFGFFFALLLQAWLYVWTILFY